MKESPSHQSRFPAKWAFVVQIAAPEAGEVEAPLGRVEHLVSGQAIHFASWPELERLIEQVLAKMEEKPP